MALAIFDLDNTLIGGDSDYAWGEFLCDSGIVDAAAYREKNDWFYREYEQGRLDMQSWLAFALEPLVGREPETLASWHARFMRDYVEPMMLPRAADLLAQHRAAGDFLLIITATNRFVTGPIARRLNVDELIASEPEVIEGYYTGRGLGTPCYQEGKVIRLNAWLADTGHTLAGSHFYSDSHNDLPLLQQVDNPVAVDPDDRLAEYASARGWPLISLRG